MNLTAVAAEGNGHLTVYPCGGTAPIVSSLNYTTGATVANNVLAPLNDDGEVCIFTHAATHLIADVSGYLVEP